MDIKALAEKVESYVIEQRRWFHAHPELSWEEYKTTDAIAAQLEGMGLEVKRFTDGLAGCTAMIYGGKAKPGCKTVALRADIDALPVEEKTGLPFASENPGCMHACGHDNHIAMLLGAAKILTEVRDELQGNVKLFFQPAEESCHGAEPCIEQGVLDGVDAIYGQHIWDGLEAPYLNVQPGARMASCDNFSITVEGSSSHGSAPNLGIDAIVAASAIIMNLQTIVSRNNNPLNGLVVSIGEIHGGQRWNVVAGKVVMEGTCRTHSREMRGQIEPLIRRIAESTAAAYKAKATLKYEAFPAPVINDQDDLNQIAHDAAIKLYGEEGIKELPKMMGSEDFAYFMEKVPGVFGFLGSHDAQHSASNHNDHYDVPEEVLKRGAAMHAQFAVDYLAAKAE
ncbi:amidohydrolase [Anaerofilum sp. BX8]|uniref:Amidohydrolase n=1 Tax=Anaerofilum hominis TaxID=2763016 RepID=A0A923I545_9FIRM|nr:amidohydrolase [Anaerofilum hominis]MBC5580495.1 amidohydrolase [Anaerofilum hominis]